MKNASLVSLTAVTVSLGSLAGCGAVDDNAGGARLRIAHLAADAPAVDVCIAPAGSGAFAGPLLASAGSSTGLAYGSVTKYLDVEATQYDVRIVAPGAANCDAPLGGLADMTDLPVLREGATATVAAIGRIDNKTSQPFRLATFVDDAEVTFGKAKLRVIHAAPGTAGVSVGFGGGAVFAPFIDNVQFGSTTQANNGYFEIDPVSGAEVTARDIVSGRDAIAIKPVDLPAGAIATAFAIGTGGDASSPLDILLCVDNAEASDLLSSCRRVGSAPERARIRVAHLSPDAPAVDVCLAPAGSGAYGRPLLRSLGATSGLWYGQVTTYVELPVSSFDVRIITATATGCEAGAVPDTLGVTTSAGLTATVAAIGVLDNQGAAVGDPTFRLAVIPDDATPVAGKTKLRFFHASPGTPNVDVGVGVAHGFTRVFANVSFGTVGGDGFLVTDPFSNAITARLADATTDALSVPGLTLASGTIVSAYAVGGKTGATANPLRVLLCTDSQAPAPGSILTPCTLAP